MDDGVIPLADDFPEPDEAAWAKLVEKTLNGQSFDKRLVSHTYEGVAIQPLYTAKNAATPLADVARAKPADDVDRAWDLRVFVDQPDPAAANTTALSELDQGAASLLVRIDPTGETGVAVGDKANLETVLDGVLLDLAPVALDADWLGVAAANWLADIAEARTLQPRLLLNLDPISAFARSGASPGPIGAHMVNAAAVARRIGASGSFLASGQVVHEAGGGEAQELGFMAAAALAYVRAGRCEGIDEKAAFEGIVLGLAADGEYFSALAKLRAARAIWARITQTTLGAPIPARIEARSSRRMLSTLDPWVNMLRLTAAGFGAGVGGADAVVLEAFSQPLGRPTLFARRQARNTQLILLEEARLGAVADPAGGAWYLEALTDQFARAGWAFMQAIEKAGGIIAALESGWIADEVGRVRDARVADIAKRKTGLIGVSEFPDLAPRSVELDLVDPAPFAKPSPRVALPGPDSVCPPLTPWRAAEVFEHLRARAAKITPAPLAYLATLGTAADHTARVGFSRNLLAAGGIPSEAGPAEAYDAAAAPLAVIASSDALYVQEAADTSRKLKAAGARRVYLAGRPGELEDQLKAAGVDGFLYAGMDAAGFLGGVLAGFEDHR